MINLYDSRDDVLKHKERLDKSIQKLRNILNERSKTHDDSKLEPPEKEIFDKNSEKLKTLEFGSKEYNESLAEMEVALKHHYAINRHHPQHHKDGIQGMTLIDLCEMVCDWYDSASRTKDGNIYKSIEINQLKFGYSDELKRILINTIKEHLE